MNLPSCYPTNPQAEVLVFANIPVKYIKFVYFCNYETLEKYIEIFDNTNMCKVSRNYFYASFNPRTHVGCDSVADFCFY